MPTLPTSITQAMHVCVLRRGRTVELANFLQAEATAEFAAVRAIKREDGEVGHTRCLCVSVDNERLDLPSDTHCASVDAMRAWLKPRHSCKMLHSMDDPCAHLMHREGCVFRGRIHPRVVNNTVGLRAQAQKHWQRGTCAAGG